VFSHLFARRPGAPAAGVAPILPAQHAGFRIPARAARPLVAVVACAAAVSLAGCKPGALTSTSSTASPSAGSAMASGTASPATAMRAIRTMRTMRNVASNAQSVKSFVAKLRIHETGIMAARVSGTLTEQTQPSPLVDVRTTVPAGLEAVLTGDMAFLKIGALTRAAGKPWVAVPFSGLKSGMGASLTPVIQQVVGSNLLAQAQMFAAAANVRNMGGAQVNGIRTTRFCGSYSLGAGLGRLTGGTRMRVRSAMMSSGITSTKFTVWVDSKHQARKISLVEVGKNTRISIVLVIVSINQPVQIQIPPANQVVGAAGTTATPTPRVTATPTPSMMTPAPHMSTPAPHITVTVTPSPVTPSPLPTDQPTHW
jgi:hypothetical protein